MSMEQINQIFREEDKKSELEIMSENFEHAIIQRLNKMGETELAEKISKGEINVELYKQKLINNGKNINIDINDFFDRQTETTAREIIKNNGGRNRLRIVNE